MEPIKINVNVQVGVTEELYSLLRNLPGVFRNVTGCVPDRPPESITAMTPS